MDSTAPAMNSVGQRISTHQAGNARQPVIGAILLGGSLTGALVRDVRLANELVQRGYEVHVWWAVDWQKTAGLDSRIKQHWLFHGFRFRSRRGSAVMEAIGRALSSVFADRRRSHWSQRRAKSVEKMMINLMHRVCDGVEGERQIVARFAREMESAGVSHMLPMLEFLCPWVAAARKQMSSPLQYAVTFQGYELYSTYARMVGRERELFDRLVETVSQSDWPAIAVSEDYLKRVVDDIGVPMSSMRAIPPGVPPAKRMNQAEAEQIARARFPAYRPGVPLVAYLGRQDTEKGIDLLLYALSILKQRGDRFQAAICGPSLWGENYHRMCRKIAEELRLGDLVMWRRFVPEDARTALFTLADCVVYPSIHREPFGMVAAEVAAHGTPAIVPDYGGVASAIVGANGESAGLTFNVWDSGDLADQISRLLNDRDLHRRLSEAGPRVADHFSIERLADRVLDHIGLPHRARP